VRQGTIALPTALSHDTLVTHISVISTSPQNGHPTERKSAPSSQKADHEYSLREASRTRASSTPCFRAACGRGEVRQGEAK